MKRRLAAIMATDVVGYSRLIRADEEGTIAALKALRADIIDPKLAEHHGRIVKLMGDGMLAEFPSVVDAVRAAVETQQAVTEHNSGLPENNRIVFRVGINLGDVVIDGDDIHGDGVNLAARLEGLAEPGGICISGSVHEQVRNRIELQFEDLGEREVKNIDRPVRVWQWIADAGLAAGVPEKTDEPLSLPDKPSIAVLPFTNMSGDPDQDYFADGITEDIITDLSKLSNLHVTARNSSFAYKNARVTVQQVATELHVNYVLEGSVRKSGENVRITAQLIDGSSDGHIWAERYDRRLSNIFELQDEIATNIVEALKVKISPQEKQAFKKYATRDVAAYENYLQARALLREMTRRSVVLAREMFKLAITQDANYVLAYCGIADCASALASHYYSEENFADEALEYSRKALEIDPTLAEARAAYGQALILIGDHAGAEREFKTAIKLEPNSYEAYFYLGCMHLIGGNADQAQPLLLRAFELTDHDLQAAMMLSSANRSSGNTKDLEKVARQTVDISEKRLKLNPEDERAAYVGASALIDLGDLKRARQWADLAAAIAIEDSRASYNLACLYGVLGDVEESLIHFEKTLKLGCATQKRNWMQSDEDLESVRLDPRFWELLEQYH